MGFHVIDMLHSGFTSGSSFQEKFGCLYLKENIQGQTVLLIKPQKYMNLSGQTAQPLLNFFKIKPQEVIVVHDDLDLPLGRIRIRRGGSSGGHNGVQDLINVLGTDEFYRIRVGIGRPMQPEGGKNVVDWVLSDFRGEEKTVISEIVKKAGNATVILLSEGLEKAQSMSGL